MKFSIWVSFSSLSITFFPLISLITFLDFLDNNKVDKNM